MTKHSKLPNKALKRTLIVSVLLALSSLFLLFIITKPKESQETLEYEGNHYFGTTYISPNLNFDEEKTTIFGKSEYLGSYTIKTLNKKSKLWSIESISPKKLIVEMNPGKSSTNFRTWTNKNLSIQKDAFEFLNPKYLTYAIQDNEKTSIETMNSQTQDKVIKEVKNILNKKPAFKTSQTIKATSTYEIYFNNDYKQSLVLQVSLLKSKKRGNVMSLSGDTGYIQYWQVSDKLLNLLK